MVQRLSRLPRCLPDSGFNEGVDPTIDHVVERAAAKRRDRHPLDLLHRVHRLQLVDHAGGRPLQELTIAQGRMVEKKTVLPVSNQIVHAVNAGDEAWADAVVRGAPTIIRFEEARVFPIRPQAPMYLA